jgi:predicted O-methyltransferase YrrM
MSIQSYLASLKQSGIERKIPNITEANAIFITDLIRKKKPKHLLEIGTANGYSTLCFAQVLEEI